MNDKPFQPLVIAVPGSGQRIVASAWEALDCLMGPWPITSSRTYRIAVQACRDALDGLRSSSAARKAFQAAAREARLDEERFGMRVVDRPTRSFGEGQSVGIGAR